ncbi:MAG: DUF72 domain-containing protein [Planctomycetota bacterium]|nr:DUF72 domain-containing protein [Planctomycetota bacterium]
MAFGSRPLFRHGTCSWSARSWVGPFYPPGTKAADFLGHYATRFCAVEADVTYYRVPDAKLVTGWARRTPEDFVLCAKFPRSIVHAGEGARPDPDRLLVPKFVDRDRDRFLEAMALLGPKCGPLVLQFPYFNRKAFPEAGPFLERLDAFLGPLPQGFRYAVEVRNPRWLDEPLAAVLRAHGAALVLVDLPYMPPPERIAGRAELFPTDFTYLRLIGDRKRVDALTETFDAVVVDLDDRLRAWADVLADLPSSVRETYAFANNHFAGHGPATIARLAALVEEAGGGGAPREPASA